MRPGDVSRTRRFGRAALWYAAYRSYRFSRRLFGHPPMPYAAFLESFGRTPLS